MTSSLLRGLFDPIILFFESHFDKNGILYHLGCNLDKNNDYVNPKNLNFVNVTSSSLHSGSIENFIDWNSVSRSNYTNGSQGEWVQIEFLKHTVSPTHYSFRHDQNPSNYLRNWKLEGSNDGNTWICLKQHTDDTSINSSLATASRSVQVDQNQFFKFFRVFKTGICSSGTNHLLMNGFEIYGKLKQI